MTGNRARTKTGGRSRTILLAALLATVASTGCGRTGEPQRTRVRVEPTAAPSETAPATPSDAVGEPAAQKPKIRFDRPDYDFGEVEAGDEVEHDFVFENVGGGLLRIEKVLTTCGCTAALSPEEEVAAGGAGKIKTTFHTRGFQGAVKKGLVVKTNDPENELVRLTIGGKVVPEIEVEPRYLNWETLQPGDSPPPKKLTVRFRKGRGLRLEKIQSESPAVVLEKESESEHKVVYSVSLADDLPAGRFTGRITIRSNSERVPEIRVPFQGRVQGNVKVTPSILSMGRLRPGKASTRYLSLSKTGGKKFTVQKVKTTSKTIATEIHEEAKGERYRIKVTYGPASDARGGIAERITIFVNDGKESFLEVPVYGSVEAADAKAGKEPD